MKINTQKAVDLNKTKVGQKKVQQEDTTPKDTVDIKSSEPSLLRKGIEGLGGVVGGIKNAATSALPATIEGGVVAANGHDADGIVYGIGKVVQGGVAGGILAVVLGGGGWAIAGASLGGVVLAGIHTALMAGEKSIDKMGKHIEKRALDSVSDFKPTGDKIHDVSSNFVTGLPSGTRAGIEAGWQIGNEEGKGTVSGLLEGAKGVGSVIAGSYEKLGEKPEEVKEGEGQEKPSVLGKIGGALKKTAEVAVGVPAGLVGAVLFLPVGPVQGFFNSAELNDDHKLGPEFDQKKALDDVNYRPSKSAKFSNALAFMETVGAGAAIGYLTMGGTAGALWGAGGGALVGGIAYGVAASTDRTEKLHEGISKAVVHAYSDNTPVDSQAYSLRRDVTEGTITGLGAGVREGFKEGYDISKEGVEVVAEGVKWVAKKVVPVAKNVVGFGAGLFTGAAEGAFKDKVVSPEKPKEQTAEGKEEVKNEN